MTFRSHIVQFKSVSITLPEPMVDLVDRAAEKEHRTRSELVRQALRLYLQGIPVEEPSSDEITAMKRGKAEIRKGAFVTLDQLRHELAPRRRKVGKQRA